MPPKKRYQWDTKDSEFEDDRPSRSQKKRDSTALQRMGEELTTLGSSVLAKMPLTPNIREAVLEWQRLSSHEAAADKCSTSGADARRGGSAGRA